MNRKVSHLTPRYIYNRIAVMLNERRHPDNPWLTANAVDILDTVLLPTDIGVEFGSGRSTKWFARHLQHLTSVENDEKWYKKVKSDLESSTLISKVDYRLQKNDDDYANQADTFNDESVDFCLVDG